MTMPNERRDSVKHVRDFLKKLLDPKETPRVPKYIRDEAGRLLRHFPRDFDMERARELAPEVFGEWNS